MGAALRIQLISSQHAAQTTGSALHATALAEGLAASGHEITYARRVDPRADAVVMVSPSLFGGAVVRRRGRPPHRPRTVLWVQDLYRADVRDSRGGAGSILARVMTAAESRVLRSFDQIVVPHERCRQYVIGTLGVPPERVTVIRNWAQVTPPRPTDRAAVRRRLGWRPGETVVLHAGTMGAEQGLETVVDAARIAAEWDLPIRFVLLGDGNRRAFLEQCAGDDGRVQFVDPLSEDDVLAALSAADVLLVNERPGLDEAAVPGKLTTYFMTGRPVLAATEPTSTTADEICASGAGITVRPGDPAALVEAVLVLRDDPDRVSRTAGPGFVRARLSQEAAVASFIALLDREQGGSPSHRADVVDTPRSRPGHDIAGRSKVVAGDVTRR